MAVKIWTGNDTKTDVNPENWDISYVGKVVALREMNGYDDSDFYAIVWDDDADEPKEVWYATTRGWTYYNSASVDATPDVAAKYDKYVADKRAAYAKYQAELNAKMPAKGKTATVVRGRKVPVGTTGTIIWVGKDNWGKDRVGIKDASGTAYWTAASNVDVVPELKTSARRN